MVREKKTKKQTIGHKILHNMNPAKKWGWSHVFRKDRLLLLNSVDVKICFSRVKNNITTVLNDQPVVRNGQFTTIPRGSITVCYTCGLPIGSSQAH